MGSGSSGGPDKEFLILIVVPIIVAPLVLRLASVLSGCDWLTTLFEQQVAALGFATMLIALLDRRRR